MLNIELPKIVALCGKPNSGKSTVQRILTDIGGYLPVDDGLPLRMIAMNHFGLGDSDVFTQEGKTRYSEIANQRWQHRDILGTLGQALEDKFGEFIMPWMGCRDLNSDKRYSFGSVRKTQGHFYRQIGGVVIEVVNENVPESPYAFDKYDPTAVSAKVVNHWGSPDWSSTDAYENLVAQVRNVLYALAGQELAAQ